MSTPWTTIELPADAHPWATVYGFVIDHVWADQGVNVARRPHWPDEMYIVVLPCDDLDEESEANGNVGAMRAWVFFENGLAYRPSDEDTAATDWLLGELEEDAECLT